MYKFFLCLRYLRKRRIAFFAVAAVSLCVAMVLIVVSVMGGFLQMVKDRSRGMLGDIVVENNTLQGFAHYDEFIKGIKAEMKDQIVEATPVIISYGVMRFVETHFTKPAEIVGLKLDEIYRVNDFKNGLFYEKYFPGTTTFADQKIPRYGLDPQRIELGKQMVDRGEKDIVTHLFSMPSPGRVILPEPLQKAWDTWLSTASDDEKKKAPRVESSWWPGRFHTAPVEEVQSLDDLAPKWAGDEFPGVIVGTDMFAKRKEDGTYDRYPYDRGDKVQLTFVPFSIGGNISQASGMPSKIFRYVDDSRTGVFDIDSISVYIDFDFAQKIMGMGEMKREDNGDIVPARTTQVQIKLASNVKPLVACDQIEKVWNRVRDKYLDSDLEPGLLSGVEVKTWEQKQERFIAAVEKERMLVTILFGIISLVSAVLVGCVLYMIVNQKTRDIGIIRSVGATSAGTGGIFIAFGAAIGIIGGAIGVLLGTVFVWHINDIQEWLAKLNPNLRVWNPEVYAFDRIPSDVDLRTAVAVYLCAILISILGSIIAAWRAARVWPVEALRYE